MPDLKVVETLFPSNARQIPEMLRMSADNISKEEKDDNPTVAMVTVQVAENGAINVYGWGDTDMLRAIGALHLGLTEISRISLGIPVRRGD